jgi:hypothetical protein
MACQRNHLVKDKEAVQDSRILLDGCMKFEPKSENERYCLVCGCHKGFHVVEPHVDLCRVEEESMGDRLIHHLARTFKVKESEVDPSIGLTDSQKSSIMIRLIHHLARTFKVQESKVNIG